MAQTIRYVLILFALWSGVTLAQTTSSGDPRSANAQEQPPVAPVHQKTADSTRRGRCSQCHLAASTSGLSSGKPVFLNSPTPGKCARRKCRTRSGAYLGICVTDVHPSIRHHIELPSAIGLLVEAVAPGSPAAEAGVELDDVVQKLDEQWIVNMRQFAVLIGDRRAGDHVVLGVIRRNEPRTLCATLAERMVPITSTGPHWPRLEHDDWSPGRQLEAAQAASEQDLGNAFVAFGLEAARPSLEIQDASAASNALPATLEAELLGISTDMTHHGNLECLGITTVTPPRALARQLRVHRGFGLLVQSVIPSSPAASAGIQQYDLLTKLDDQFLVNREQFSVLLRGHEAHDLVDLTLLRGGKAMVLEVVLGEHAADEPSEQGWAGFEDWNDRFALYRMEPDGGLVNLWKSPWRCSREAHKTGHLPGGEVASEPSDTEMIDLSGSKEPWHPLRGSFVSRPSPGEARTSEDDAVLGQRLYLDIIGTAPSDEELRAFVGDRRPNKVDELINSLLARPEVIARFNGTASVQWSDDRHVLTLTTLNGRPVHLLARSAEGSTLFDGPFDGQFNGVEQPLELSSEVTGKISKMLLGLCELPLTVQD